MDLMLRRNIMTSINHELPDYAVQSYMPSANNYNPAMSIILANNNYGTYVNSNDKTRGWYLTYEQAAVINIGTIFQDKSTVTDTYGICGTIGEQYDFTKLDLEYFTTMTTLGGYANLARMAKLEEISLPSTLTTTSGNFLYSCSNLRLIKVNSVCSGGYGSTGSSSISVIFKDGLTSIGQTCLNNLTSLTSVEIPNSVTSIGDSAFSGCSNLTSVVLPINLVSIGSGSFRACGFSDITIPTTVTSISTFAFQSCTNLRIVNVLATTPPSITTNTFYGDTLDHIYVPSESVNVYKATIFWSSYSSIIESLTN